MAKAQVKIEFGRSLDPRALNFWWNRHDRHVGGGKSKDTEADRARLNSKGDNKMGN